MIRLALSLLIGGMLLAQSPKPIPTNPKTLDEYRVALKFAELRAVEAEARAAQAEARSCQQEAQGTMRTLQPVYEAARRDICVALKLSDKCIVDTHTGTASEPPQASAKEPEKK